jgi:hypothetical protein
MEEDTRRESAGFLEDDSGNKSSMRLLTVYMGGFVIFMLMTGWFVLSLKKNEFIHFDIGEILMILVIFLPKLGQKIIEVFGPLMAKRFS